MLVRITIALSLLAASPARAAECAKPVPLRFEVSGKIVMQR